MFTVRIADISVKIENRYSFVEKQCKNYMIAEEPSEFIVSVTEEELEAEQRLTEGKLSKGYYESTCIYRKICEQLLRYDVFLVHSSVVAVEGEAYVFAAKSGTGKSTHTSLWLECFGDLAVMVNGDKPLFRYLNGEFYVYGTPWCGKEGLESNLKVPVKAFCFLERNSENVIRKISNDEIIKRIFHQVLLPKIQPQMSRFLNLIDQMIKEIPFYLLQCNISKEAAVMAYEGMKERI